MTNTSGGWISEPQLSWPQSTIQVPITRTRSPALGRNPSWNPLRDRSDIVVQSIVAGSALDGSDFGGSDFAGSDFADSDSADSAFAADGAAAASGTLRLGSVAWVTRGGSEGVSLRRALPIPWC